ncbi:MAG: hypothetical protein KAW49_09135 [Anaerolineae bacterium]|nr:hypothetical protein [Anaerolineae bacterium]
MKGKLYILGLMLVLSVVIVSGCVPATAQPTEVPTTAPTEAATAQPTEVPTTTPMEVAEEAPEEVQAARDVALAFISGRYSEQAPALGLTWTEEDITPEGLVGSVTYQYTAEDWVVTITYPIVPPEQIVYQVAVANQATGFQWEGEVNAVLQVTETLAPTGGQPVVGWMGRVVSLPAGGQFDDYLALEPEGAGEIGLTGADNTVEAQIQVLRYSDIYAHFWGTLTCPVLDYGGCQLVVTRLREARPGTSFDPDPVEGWEGTVGRFAYGSQHDDYFVLAGDFPVRYGIESPDPTLAAQLEGLRDTGTPIRVWGQVECGVLDACCSCIEVNRIEVVGEAPPVPMPPPTPAPTPVPTPMPTAVPTPTPPEVGESVEGWIGTIVQLTPGSQYKEYFERNDGQRYGIEGADDAVRGQIEGYRWTGAQVQVWGRLHTGVPAPGGRSIQVERIEAISGPATEARNLTPFATSSSSSHLPTDHGGSTNPGWPWMVRSRPPGWRALPSQALASGLCSPSLAPSRFTTSTWTWATTATRTSFMPTTGSSGRPLSSPTESKSK